MVSTKTFCKLCNLPKLSKVYYECFEFIVCDCITCKVPLYVSRKHEDDKKILKLMVEDAKRRFPNRKIDLRRRSIPDHQHLHCR